MQTFKGKIRQLSGSSTYELWTTGGKVIEPIQCSWTPPLEVPVEVQLDGYRLTNYTFDDTQPAALRHETYKNIALCYVLEEEPAEKDRKRVEDAARFLEYELKFAARNQWDIRVTPYCFKGPTASSVRNVDFKTIKQRVSEINPNHDHNYWHVWSGRGDGFCGNAYINSDEAYTSATCDKTTILHEQLHNLGLHHSGMGTQAYGDKDSWMGASSNRNRILGPQLDYLGLIDEQNVAELQEGNAVRYFLVDPNTAPNAVREKERKIVYVNKGISRKIAVCYENGKVKIYRPDPENSSRYRKTWTLHELKNTGDLAKPYATEVRFVREYEGGAEVIVKYSDAHADPSPQPTPDWNVETPGLSISEESTGLWYHPLWDFQGVSIEVREKQVFGMIYTWTRSQKPIYYQFDGSINENGVAEVEIYAPSSRDMLKVGRGIFYLHDSKNGVLKYFSEDEGLVSFPLNLLMRADPEKTIHHKIEGKDTDFVVIMKAKEREQTIAYWAGKMPPKILGFGSEPSWVVFDSKNGDALGVSNGYPRISNTIKTEVIGSWNILEESRKFSAKFTLNEKLINIDLEY